MKRDMDLIRSLLLEIEANDALADPVVEDPKIVDHLKQLDESNFVEGLHFIETRGGPAGCQPLPGLRITSAGHDFLDSIRNDTVWSKTKARLSAVGGATAIGVIKSLAIEVSKEALGLKP